MREAEHVMKNNLVIFEDYNIRRLYDEKTETWYFSVVDIIQALTQQADFQTARKYWNKLKERLSKEGSEVVTNCHQLKMAAEDGKQRLTDVATRQIAETSNATGMEQNKRASKTGGAIAKQARLQLEGKTGQKVVTGSNFLPSKQPQSRKIEKSGK
jgi:hypothetical protein